MTITMSGYSEITSLMSRMTGDEKHTAAATWTLDVLWVLYDRVLSVSPERLADPDRDRFDLSKGHLPEHLADSAPTVAPPRSLLLTM